MKKLISIALAAAMLAAVSVPAFAANPITKETEQTGTLLRPPQKQAPIRLMMLLSDTPFLFRQIQKFTGAPRRQILFTLLSLTSREARLSRLP